MQRLWDVLLANGVNPAAGGWTNLNFATGVSANGSAIVGEGFRNGNREAFVAVVPEPAGLMAVSAAFGALAVRRRSRVVGCGGRGGHC